MIIITLFSTWMKVRLDFRLLSLMNLAPLMSIMRKRKNEVYSKWSLDSSHAVFIPFKDFEYHQKK